MEYLPFDSIRQCEWDNKTCSDTKILSSIQEKKLKVRSDLSAIKALGSEIEDTLLKVYRESGNVLSAAVQRNISSDSRRLSVKQRAMCRR